MDVDRFRAAERRYWDTLGVTPVEQWVPLPATGGQARVLAVGDGPPLLFVHGSQNGATSWGELAVRLPTHRCLLLDRPGCGLSPPAPAAGADLASFERLADGLVVDVLDGLGIERAPIVGTSLGGYHVLRSAAAHPDRIERVLTLGWSLGVPNEQLPLVMRLAGIRRLGQAMARIPVSDLAARALLKRIGLADALATGRMTAEAVDWYRALLNHTDTARNEVASAPALVDLRRGFNPALLFTDEFLASLAVPVHLVWGADDPFGGAHAAATFAPRIPGATLRIVPGGHAVWMDDPDRIATLVAAWAAP